MKRIMIAAPKSGSGKTLITCGLLRLMTERGLDTASFKCGPDYIDPMFHRRVLGVPGGNLDSFFSDENEIREIFSRVQNEYTVIEGVMGIYDGISAAGRSGPGHSFDLSGSCYDIARITDTPVVLVVDVKGMGQTMLSVIKGILSDDTSGLIRGIILNRITPHYYEQIAPLIRSDLADRASLLGGIPVSSDIKLESRHLGLVMPGEIDDLMMQVDTAAGLLERYIDIDALLNIMKNAGISDTKRELYLSGAGSEVSDHGGSDISHKPVLAVARDEAFCFYYEENLRILEAAGVTIKEFSPLHDEKIPDEADGLLLGGGYPELYASQLSSNASMIASIQKAISDGMPSLAECGGFMYLLDELEDQTGVTWPMCGSIRGTSRYTGRLSRFGYISITLPDGMTVRGHEFHYFDSDNNGTDARAVKPGSGKSWDCIHYSPDHIWGYPHLWYRSCPDLVSRFRDSMMRFHRHEELIQVF